MDPRDADEDEDDVEFFDALDCIPDPKADDGDDGDDDDQGEEEEALSDPTSTPLPHLETIDFETLDSDASELTSQAPSQEGDANLDRAGDVEDPPRLLTLLEHAVEFAVKAVSFQIALLAIFVKLPFWLIRFSFLIVVDPYGVAWRAANQVKNRLSGAFTFLFETVVPAVFGKAAERQVAVHLVARLARGCFCSLYVCCVLFAFLAASFLGGGLMVRRLVEEPVQVTDELSFDYTKANPEALVPIPPYGGCSFSGENFELADYGVWRLVPPNQKMRLTVSLTLPESDYNRNLGVFQVRAEFLSSNGNVTSSSRQPCILLFKSSHIRLLETFLKSMFLLAGYSSQSQVLRLHMKGLTEGIKPTVCIRVTLEKRAEFRPGAGIPEIYAASMKLESELSLFERILWNWRMTIFIWTSMVLFISQLLIILVCCTRLIIPSA